MSERTADHGWIKWDGGKCPIQSRDFEVMYRDGIGRDFAGSESIGRSDIIWAHLPADSNNDIIAYRVAA